MRMPWEISESAVDKIDAEMANPPPRIEWRSREQKLKAVRYWWREQRGVCHICKDRENPMEPYSQAAISPWAATVEHVIPKRENGPDTMENMRLAHRWCNNVLGALWQKGLDLLTEEWALSNARGTLYPEFKEPALRRGVRFVPVPETVVTGFRFLMPLPRGATLPKETPPPTVFEHSAHKPARKLTGVELARAVAKIVDKPRKKKRRKPRPIKGIEFDRLYTAEGRPIVPVYRWGR